MVGGAAEPAVVDVDISRSEAVESLSEVHLRMGALVPEAEVDLHACWALAVM
jgi:hypothetical protein